MFKNKGERLESLVQHVYQVLSNTNGEEVEVKKRHNIIGKSGTIHNIDVYYEFELNGITHRVLFECKNWNKSISKDKVLAFNAIIEDVHNSVGVIVSSKGYQRGAEQYGRHHGINLITASEESLLCVVARERIKVLLPEESVIGEPFYCLMEKNQDGDITGTYVTTKNEKSGESFLLLFFSKKEAEEFNTSENSVVRGITKRHLEILCGFSETLNLKIAINIFMTGKAIGVEAKFIRAYFL